MGGSSFTSTSRRHSAVPDREVISSKARARVAHSSDDDTSSFFTVGFALESELQHFRKVHCFPAGCLLDLFPATKSVGNNQRFGSGASHCGQQDSFSHSLRHGKFSFLKSERPGHSATT